MSYVINVPVNTKIYTYENDEEICDHVKMTNFYLKYVGDLNTAWQKEKMLYCSKCDKYYIKTNDLSYYQKKYKNYYFIQNKYENSTDIIKNLKCYIIGKKYKHVDCNGYIRKEPFTLRNVIVTDKNENKYNITVSYCEYCKKYFLFQNEMIEIKKNIPIIIGNEKQELNNRGLKPKLFKNEIVLRENSILHVVKENECIKEKHITNECIYKIQSFINENTRIFISVKGTFCENCKKYFTTEEEFEQKISKRKINCEIKFEYQREPKIIYESPIIKKEKSSENIKLDFFVRTSSMSCAKNKHNIADVSAEIDLFNGKKIIKYTLPAFYCKECNLYFMFNHTYEKLRRKGIPLCQIYIYEKYIKKNVGELQLNQESLLHAFGYNVNAIEGLTEKFRHKILTYIIENGYMKKVTIISMLNYFIDMRKGQLKHSDAIKKWKSDIEFLNRTVIESSDQKKVNSIKIINYINK